jgi:hypothetical protein
MFLKVRTFMELAENDFKIAETVRRLNSHIKEIEKLMEDGGVTDQHDASDCENVCQSAHIEFYLRRVWRGKNDVKFLAYKYLRYDFVDLLNYNWYELGPQIKSAYNLFRGKKVLFWRAQKIENVFKARTKRLQAIINTGNTGHGQQETEKKEALIAATASYKEVFSEILKNSGSAVENQYKAIESTVAVYDANKEYSKLVTDIAGSGDKKLNGYQEKIAKWLSLVEPLFDFKADRKAGFYPDSESIGRNIVMGDIYLSQEEQLKAAKKMLGDTLGNFNIDRTDREEEEVRVGAYRLVSPETYASASTSGQTTTQQQQQPTRSTGSSSQTHSQATQPQTRSPQQRRTTGSTTNSGKTRYVCIDCGNEMALYPHDRRNCSQCGHTGCLDRIS